MIQPKHYLLSFLFLSAFCFSPIGLFGNNAPLENNDYCVSTSNFPWEDWIARVDISNLFNASGKSPYSDFTNTEVNLDSGNSYIVKLSTGYSYFTTDEYWRIWIDYNADGDFDDPLETVFSGVLAAPADGTPLATLNGTINIPAGAPEFSTRMRIAMTRGDFADPCAVLEFGEVEDYTVNITNLNAQPDLSFVSHEFFPGENLCFTKAGTPFLGFFGTIVNSGIVDSAPFKVRITWSKDDEVSADDVFWTELEYPGLESSSVTSLSVDDPVPSNLEPEVYYVIVQIDPDNEIIEKREENNFIRSRQYIEAPDFSVGNISGAPSSIAGGNAISVNVELTNLQAFPLDDWSRDVNLSLRLATEPILAYPNYTEIGSLERSADQFSNAPTYLNGTVTANIDGLIPTDTPSGDYYLFVQLLNTCDEERSNDISAPIPIQITSPDLDFVSYEFFPGEFLCYTDPGTSFSGFNTTIANVGNDDSDPYKIKVHWSKDELISADDVLWKELEYPGLAAGNATSLEILDPVPSTLEPGRYYMIIQLDSDNEITERNEDNNFIRSLQYIAAPDFTVEAVNGIPATLSAGDAISVDVELKNLKAYPLDEWAQEVTLALRLSTEPIITSAAPIIGAVHTLSADQFSNAPTYLNGTATANISRLIPTDTPAGDYYLFVQILYSCDEDRNNNSSAPMPIQISVGTQGNYCTSTSDYPWEEWISGVALANLDNTSGKTKYSDFTSQSANLSIGDFNTIRLTSSYSYFTEDEYWRVWMDLNQDGDFADAGEMLLERVAVAPPNGTPSKSIQDGLQVPAGTMPGTTRMRVSMKRGAFPEPCETLPFGEVEDYKVQLSDDGPLPNLTSPSYEFIPGGTFLCYSDLQGGFASFGVVLVSLGETVGPFKVRATWSKDDQLSADDVVWMEVEYDGLADFMAVDVDFPNTPIPASLEPGIYYLFIAIDADDEIAESNELDNIIRSRQRLGAPDFLIEELTGIPADLAAGENFNVAMTLKNLEPFPLAENTGSLPVDFYLSEDATLSSSSDELIGSFDIDFDGFSNPPFYENGTTAVDLNLNIPGTIAAGNYFLFARVGNTVCESYKLNNVSSAFPLEITGGNTGVYCTSDSDFPWHEWIENVSLENLDNTSAKSNYSDFTNLSANLERGTSYPLSLTTGFSYFTEDEYWSVWIDYNLNKVFENSELVYSQMVDAPADGIGSNTVSGTISIPSTAQIGTTRMRIAMNRGSFASACATLPFGEVEDYSIIIGTNSPNNRSTHFSLNLAQNKNKISLEGWYQSTEEVKALSIEKSLDGKEFGLLEKLSPNKNADDLYWINTSDLEPLEGNNFYRAVVHLKNGKEVHSAIQSIDFSAPVNFSLSPNPARSQVVLTLEELSTEPIHWRIQDAYGQLLWSQALETTSGTSFQIEIDHLVPGMYYMVGKRPGKKIWTKKFVVVR